MRADGGADVEAPVDVTRQLAGSGPEAPKPTALAAAACSMCVFLRQGNSPPPARGCVALRHRDSGGAARQPSAPPAACRGSAVQVAPSAGTVPLTRKPIVAALAQLPIAPPCP